MAEITIDDVEDDPSDKEQQKQSRKRGCLIATARVLLLPIGRYLLMPIGRYLLMPILRILFFPFRAIIYIFNPRNWCKDIYRFKIDMRLALAEIPDGHKRVALYGRLSRFSRSYGMAFIKFLPGLIILRLPFTSSRKVRKWKRMDYEVIDALKEYPNIQYKEICTDLKFYKDYRRNDKEYLFLGIIEIDAINIRKNCNGDRKCAIRKIRNQIEADLKVLMEAMHGDDLPYIDELLLNSLGKAFYNCTRIECPTNDLFLGQPKDAAFNDSNAYVIFTMKGVLDNIYHMAEKKQYDKDMKRRMKELKKQGRQNMSSHAVVSATSGNNASYACIVKD